MGRVEAEAKRRKQLEQQYSAIQAQIDELSKTVSPYNPQGSNPRLLSQLQSQQAKIWKELNTLTQNQTAREQEQRVQQEYAEEAEAANQQHAEELQKTKPQNNNTSDTMKKIGEEISERASRLGDLWEAYKHPIQTIKDYNYQQKNAQAMSDYEYFKNRNIYVQYAKAKQKLAQMPATQRPWSNENKIVKEFEQRYKRYFGKEVDNDAVNLFYNDYSLQNVENGDIPNMMTELANKWYGSQIESMADQYAGAGLGTANALMNQWKQNEHGQGTLRSIDIPAGVKPDKEGEFIKGPENMKQFFKTLLLDYYRCVAYKEYLTEMIRNGQASAMIASTGASDELQYWDELIQSIIPADLADYESELNMVYQRWSKFAQAVVMQHNNSLTFKDINWTDKGGGHGSGFYQLPDDQPTEDNTSVPSASSATGTTVPEAAKHGTSNKTGGLPPRKE